MNRQRFNSLRIIIGLLLLVSGLQVPAYSQGRFTSYFDSDSFWRSIKVLDEDALIAADADTLVALVSNRVLDYEDLKFAKEVSEPSGQLHYFLAFVKEGKWSIKACKDLSSLLERLDKGKSLVVYTEGYGKNFPAGLFRAFAMRAQYGVNVLYLDYPSINSTKQRLGNWRFVLKEANKAGVDFVPVLDSLYHYPLREYHFPKITLFYHSMGNLALKNMLKNDFSAAFSQRKWVDNLVLNAACVPAKGYTQWLEQAHFARNILIHYNPEDRTLKGAQLISGNRKIGVQPGEKVLDKVLYLNFNRFVGDGHSYFLDLPYREKMAQPVADYMQRVLNGAAINVQDTLVFRPLDGESKYELVE
ncbi:MAG: hypothetical protein BGO31_01215 [Bacteroidetes bacterium 43-16]|nr:MAG: hypothetical protein BGO31_01215 [Bacteroidetes bacterium 43-16]